MAPNPADPIALIAQALAVFVGVALANLIAVGVMELSGDRYRLTESFGSDLKAHPGHPQNRGEKPFRVRLLQYLEKLQESAR